MHKTKKSDLLHDQLDKVIYVPSKKCNHDTIIPSKKCNKITIIQSKKCKIFDFLRKKAIIKGVLSFSHNNAEKNYDNTSKMENFFV